MLSDVERDLFAIATFLVYLHAFSEREDLGKKREAEQYTKEKSWNISETRDGAF